MINLSKIAYPEVKRVIDVGCCHDYLIGAGKKTATVRSLKSENINSCTAGVLSNGKNHFMFHAAPELQPVSTIKKEIEKQVNILRETCDNVKAFICGGLELNKKDSVYKRVLTRVNAILEEHYVNPNNINRKQELETIDNLFPNKLN